MEKDRAYKRYSVDRANLLYHGYKNALGEQRGSTISVFKWICWRIGIAPY
jgi:hypothetical protein